MDLLTDGRLELGLGAGYVKSEYEQVGLRFDLGGTRVERLAEAVAPIATGAAGPVHEVVEVTQNMGSAIDKVQVGGAIDSAESGVGQLQHIDILHGGSGIELPAGKLHGLGCT